MQLVVSLYFKNKHSASGLWRQIRNQEFNKHLAYVLALIRTLDYRQQKAAEDGGNENEIYKSVGCPVEVRWGNAIGSRMA
jgi:hypothetical protein